MRLLVVEDEARLAAALQRGLQAEGFAVDVSGDGQAGLEMARHGGYDAMILDVMLPRLSGYRVVRQLRAEQNWLPVLMLSAKDGEYDQADGLDCGADDYLTKPFSYVVLLARLRALLRRGAGERPVVLAHGDVELDPAERRVTVAGREVLLTAREFALLEYLMRRAGQVVSKIELLDHVWDAAVETAPNAVEVYVGYLRRKIGRERLETVRGAGYRLAAERDCVMRRPRELSLRARLLLVSVVALAAGLGAGGVLLVGALDYALLRGVNAETLDTARGIAKLVDQNQLSEPIPVTAEMKVQVVDAQDRVLSISAGADRLVAMLHPDELRQARDGSGRQVPASRVGENGTVRVVVVTAGPPTNPVYVLVARPTDDIAEGVHVLRVTLLIVFPLLVGLLAVVLWRVLGAALRPVDALTAGAEEITGGSRAGRLPVPASRDEIHRLAVTLNGMLARLDAARIRQRAFVADAAHELRSPLTNMRTELEVAQRLPGTTDWPQLAGDLLTDVDRLSRLVDDLLLLARSDDGDARAPAGRVEEVELGQFLTDLAARYPDVTYLRPAAPLTLPAEPDALARVVGNLLDNAVRHRTSHVRLSAAPDGPYQRVTVTDDGPGIQPVDRERVFDRFTRLDDGRARDAGGSGLGLAIVRELVRRHRGTVTLSDAEPGLRVDVRLPAAR